MPGLQAEGDELTIWDYLANTAIAIVYLKGVKGFIILEITSDGNIVPLPAQVDKSLEGVALIDYLAVADGRLGGLLSISAKYRSGRVGLPSGTIYVNDKLIDFSTWETIEGWHRTEVKRIYTKDEQLTMDKLREMYKKLHKG